MLIRISASFIISSTSIFNQILPYAEAANEWGQSFQVDVYVQRNQWGQSQESVHNVLVLRFPLEKQRVLAGTTKFTVVEEHTKQTQILHLNQDHIFYPKLFQGKDHKEYNLPVCGVKKTCDAELFVFVSSWQKPLGPSLKVSLEGWDAGSNKKIMSHVYPDLENKLRRINSSQMPRIQVSYQKKGSLGRVVLSRRDSLNLRAQGVKHVDVMFQWRADAEQVEYTEHQERRAVVGTEQRIEHKLPKDPFYFGALLFYEINGVTFESKMEIVNKADGFYRGTSK